MPALPDRLPGAFTRALTPASALRYLMWRLAGTREPVWLQLARAGWMGRNGRAGPWFQLRPRAAGNSDDGVAYEIFVHRYYASPRLIEAEQVRLIVDLGANVGMSCLFWLTRYKQAQVVAFEPHPRHAAQCQINVARNGFADRLALHQQGAGVADAQLMLTDAGTSSSVSMGAAGTLPVQVVDIFPLLLQRPIDILKIDIEGAEVAILNDPRFASVQARAIAMEWHSLPDGQGGKAWCEGRLRGAGYDVVACGEDQPHCGMVWAYRGG